MTESQESVDNAKQDELREILEEEGLQELIADFFELASTDVTSLLSAVNNSETENIFRISHGLKSSSGNLGFMKMSELCRKLEVQARNDELADARSQASNISEEFNHLKRLLG